MLFWDWHTIPQTVPTLLRDRHTISAKQQLMPSEPTHDPTTNLGCSDTNCCAQDNNLFKESTNQAATDAAGDVPNTTRIDNNREKQSIKYLTRFGNVPTSSGQERDFIDSTINYNLFLLQGISRGRFSEGFSGIQYIRALALIYSHIVSGF